MNYFITIMLLIFSLSLAAKEIKVADITTDALDESTVFYLDINTDNTLQGMHYITTAGSGQILDDAYHTVDEVLDGGVVVKVMENREIVRLFLEKFDREQGGKVRLQYLSNGVTGAKESSYLNLKKVNSSFKLLDLKDKEVNLIFVKGSWSRLLRRWIGVERLEFSLQ